MSNVIKKEDVLIENIGEGITRKVLTYSDNIMLVEICFEANSVGALHSHSHEQCTYVLSGKFEFTIKGEKHVVEKGDSIYFSPNDEHGTICLEKGVLIDVFTPKRNDFLK